MTKVIVTVDTKSNATLFLNMVRALKFVKKVETDSPLEYPDLSSGEIQMLEERWTDYLKNPKAVTKWEKVKKDIQKKYER